MDRWLVAGSILFITIGISIIAPLPLDGSWLWYWEFGLDPWSTILLSLSMILVGIVLAVEGFKKSSPSQA